MNIKNVAIVFIVLLALIVLHQEIELRADKQLEAYKFCLNNHVYPQINFTNTQDNVELCNEL